MVAISPFLDNNITRMAPLHFQVSTYCQVDPGGGVEWKLFASRIWRNQIVHVLHRLASIYGSFSLRLIKIEPD